jgi:hypothetical protein
MLVLNIGKLVTLFFDKRSVLTMLERLILKFSMIFGILSFPTLFKKPTEKIMGTVVFNKLLSQLDF